MFDIAFGEIFLIALVALIVIGPERLPKVARTLGHLLGRMQRYVNDVKADISREMELDELRKLQSTVEDAARSIEQSVHAEVRATESKLDAINEAATETASDVSAAEAPPVGGARPPCRTRVAAARARARRSGRGAAQAGLNFRVRAEARQMTQDTFISHLVELRDRLLRCLIAIAVVFVCLFPWAKDLYTLLAPPLLAGLPEGGQMIATDVVGVFLVPVKVAGRGGVSIT